MPFSATVRLNGPDGLRRHQGLTARTMVGRAGATAKGARVTRSHGYTSSLRRQVEGGLVEQAVPYCEPSSGLWFPRLEPSPTTASRLSYSGIRLPCLTLLPTTVSRREVVSQTRCVAHSRQGDGPTVRRLQLVERINNHTDLGPGIAALDA